MTPQLFKMKKSLNTHSKTFEKNLDSDFSDNGGGDDDANDQYLESNVINIDGTDFVAPTTPEQLYAARPDSLEHISLAQFRIWYTRISKNASKAKMMGAVSSHQIVCPHLTDPKCMPFVIKLKDPKLGFMRLRQFPAVLRFHKYKEEHDPHEFYYSQLMLFMHWRNENELHPQDFDNCFKLFLTKLPDNPQVSFIETVKSSLFPKMNIVNEYRALMEDLDDDIRTCKIADVLDNQNAQDNEESNLEGNAPNPDYDVRGYEGDFVNDGPLQGNIFKTADFSKTNEMRALLRKLAPEQRLVFDKIIGYAKELRKFKAGGGEKPEAPLIVVHGGAGSGKSTLIKVLSFWFEKLLATNDERDLKMPFVIRCAPTGMAAYGIDGLTICSAFKFKFDNKHRGFVDKDRDYYQQILSHLQLVIIDEMSMVKSDELCKIDAKLREIKSNPDKEFGGVAVVLLGDLMQLRPIKGKWIFQKPMDQSWWCSHGTGKDKDSNALWKLFTPHIFNENHRQGDDKEYGDLLNRLRFGNHTEDDTAKLRSRIVKNFPEDVPKEAIFLFGKNKYVKEYNNKKLNELDGKIFTATAIHINNFSPKIVDNDIGETQFHQELSIKVGARVMLIYNVMTTDGLTNGACGYVVAVETSEDNPEKPQTVVVVFDNPEAGTLLRNDYPNITKKYGANATPINRVTLEYSLGISSKEHSAKVKLIQFPLKLAWALTAHKVQGQTIKDPTMVGMDLQTTFSKAQPYVMLGRTENIKQIYLAEFEDKKLGADEKSLEQTEELQKRATDFLASDKWLTNDNGFKLSALNVRSLQSSFKDVELDHHLMKSDVIALSETWYPEENFVPPELDGYQAVHVMSGRGAGVSLFIRNNIKIMGKPKTIKCDSFQIIKAKIERATVILVYRSPSFSSHSIFTKELMNILPRSGPTFICGDFNIHPQEPNEHYNELVDSLSSKGFLQRIDKATHKDGHILDHLYVRGVHTIDWHFHHPYYSDHDSICCLSHT